MSIDFTISPLQRHADGFFFATVRSHHSQEEVVCHNRYGAWFIGDPNAPRNRERMRDIRPKLAAELQARKIAAVKELDKFAGNPFMDAPAPPPAPAPNPFMAL